jgi:hypothetical protein
VGRCTGEVGIQRYRYPDNPRVSVKSWIFVKKRVFDIDKLQEGGGAEIWKGNAEAPLFSSDRETFVDETAIIVPNIVYIVVVHNTC